MIRCSKCGKQIPEDSIFCTFCGQNLKLIDIENNTVEEKEKIRKMEILPICLCNYILCYRNIYVKCCGNCFFSNISNMVD